jgi:hypothetical protein
MNTLRRKVESNITLRELLTSMQPLPSLSIRANSPGLRERKVPYYGLSYNSPHNTPRNKRIVDEEEGRDLGWMSSFAIRTSNSASSSMPEASWSCSPA